MTKAHTCAKIKTTNKNAEKVIHIGLFKFDKKLTFTHAGSEVPFTPTSTEENIYKWSWDTLFDSELDTNAELEEKSYIGAVSIKLPQSSVREVKVLAGGELAAPDKKFDRLIFKQTCLGAAPKITWKKNHKLGEYTVTYEDGTAVSYDARYGNSVMRYDIPYADPKPQQYYRHFGYVGTWFSDPVLEEKTEDGKNITVYGLIWENPHPDKKLQK